jgi:endonuclease/exonuclease/phosphatase family metal-dependent hydrolase
MKLITLNTWGGRKREPLLDFIGKHADTDIFCFQEVYHQATGIEIEEYKNDMLEMFSEMKDLLPNHTGYFHPHFADYYGLALFHKKTLELSSLTEVFVHRQKEESSLKESGHHPRNVEIARFKGGFTVMNFHGLWNGKGKTDAPERIAQSERLAGTIQEISGEIVLAGDFNLDPGTESLRVIEETGLRNLIKEFGIINTRTSLYKKEGRCADYVLVSPGIKVVGFRVLPDEVSDHAALELEFEI